LPFGISPLRCEIPPATSPIPKPLGEILKNKLFYLFELSPFGIFLEKKKAAKL